MRGWFYAMMWIGLFWSTQAVCQNRFYFQQGEQQLELRLLEPLLADSQSLRAELWPGQIPVRVRNQLILLTRPGFSLASLPTAVRRKVHQLELLHHYLDQYIYLLSTPSLRDALQLLPLLQQRPDIIQLQPDLLPFRGKLVEKDAAPQMPVVILQYDATKFNLFRYAALDQLWVKTRGKGARIAVIDNGFSFKHQVLQQVKPVFSHDVDMNIPGAVAEQSGSHGDKVAALIWGRARLPHKAEQQDPLSGQAFGLAPEAAMIALKLTKPWTSQLLRAFILAEQQQADVINLSWLLPWVAAPLQDYLRYLVQTANHGKGIVIVAAANPARGGNHGLAAMPELLVVSSTDHQGQLANASWGPSVDLAAVSFILSIDPSDKSRAAMMAKTSASAPVVSAVVALLRVLVPDLTARQIELLLTDSAEVNTQLDVSGVTQDYKILKVAAALQQITPVPASD